MCEKCHTLHLSNFSVAIQYGDDMPPSPCICECHLNEGDTIHGKASREWQKQHTVEKVGQP